jgi:hypothetical protein
VKAIGLHLIPIAVAVLGGVFFGLFSCGGYVWHWTAFRWLLGVSCILALAAPSTLSWPRRAGLIALVIPVYLIAEALAAPFYPDTPSSVGEFLHRFVQTLETGPS